MNIEFLIPFILLVLSFSWMSCTKAASERNYAAIAYYDSLVYQLGVAFVILCIIIGLIICWVNAGFLIFLAYLGITLGIIVLGQISITAVLVAIFGYGGISAILPLVLGIVSAIWMFAKSGSF